MTYCFDLDGTLCTITNGDYDLAKPLMDRISVVNNLYESGNHIIINTARGSKTGIDWYDKTENQIKNWGLNFHELYVGVKIDADLFIDDKAVSDKIFFENIQK
jgi:hypothetical protein